MSCDTAVVYEGGCRGEVIVTFSSIGSGGKPTIPRSETRDLAKESGGNVGSASGEGLLEYASGSYVLARGDVEWLACLPLLKSITCSGIEEFESLRDVAYLHAAD